MQVRVFPRPLLGILAEPAAPARGREPAAEIDRGRSGAGSSGAQRRTGKKRLRPAVKRQLVVEVMTTHEMVPRQHSSGGRSVLLGISKRGDRYLRALMIHGARSALRVAERRRDPRSIWIGRIKLRRGPNVAAVALANKNARVIWARLLRGDDYRTRAVA
jgi:Transposase IS116/IS110/IS902 family